MEYEDYIPPTDDVIEAAQQKLGVTFHPGYVAFIKSGYDLGDSSLECLEVDEPESYVDMFEICEEAWEVIGVPRNLLPIVDDNADYYYCINEEGGIDFWSHNSRSIEESWPSISEWIAAMKAEAGD